MSDLPRNPKVAFAFAATITLAGFAFWYVYPVMTFGGRYYHHEGGATYNFHHGSLFENGANVGNYSVHLRTVTIDLKVGDLNESIDATIGWKSVSMPLPKYGQSRLMQQDRE